ncbi:GNAT family N-acetyltransferase [Lysinibacter cavernae]
MRPYTMTEPLHTERLMLRLMRADDLNDIYSYQSDPDACRYLPYEPRSREAVRQNLEVHSKRNTIAEPGDYLRLAIQSRLTSKVLGELYFRLDSTVNRSAEVGWALHPEQHGKGFAAEAASALLDFAFDRVGIHRIFAKLDVRNSASAELCTRLGMRREALFIDDEFAKGEWTSTAIYAVLEREWAARQS